MSNDNICVLIVDDEKDLLEMYREFFEMDGFKVFTASSAKEALCLYENHPNIKLIISDANMGDISGVELLKVLKKNYRSVPVFYLATGAMETTEEEIKALGGTGLLLKPFDLDEILLRIKRDLEI